MQLRLDALPGQPGRVTQVIRAPLDHLIPLELGGSKTLDNRGVSWGSWARGVPPPGVIRIAVLGAESSVIGSILIPDEVDVPARNS